MSVLSDEAVVAAHELLPAHCVPGLLAYFNERRGTGSFLHAVLCNNLVLAWMQADVTNRANLAKYAEWLCYYAPAEAYGSPDTVRAWLEAK